LQGFDWQVIAEKCGSTKGAVSKRYSRMQLAFERGDAPPPSTPIKGKKDVAATPKKTPAKTRVKSEGDDEAMPTSTPKRKRTPSKKKVDYTEAEDDEEERDEKTKRAKSILKAKPRPKNAFRASDDEKPSKMSQTVKSEPTESDDDVFTDTREQGPADIDAESEVDEVCKCFHPLPLPILAPLSLVEDGTDTLSVHFDLLGEVCACKRDG
jgi:hypothetical protein